MGEWAFFPDFSVGSMYGVIRNPYDLDRNTAGSSGGTAAGKSTVCLLASLQSILIFLYLIKQLGTSTCYVCVLKLSQFED